jgi:hypothetical protein
VFRLRKTGLIFHVPDLTENPRSSLALNQRILRV